MHLQMILLALVVTILVHHFSHGTENWGQRWRWARIRLAIPPLFLTSTALAILSMSMQGALTWDNQIAFFLATFWLLWVGLCGFRLTLAAQRTVQNVQKLPRISIAGQPARLVQDPGIFAAQVGFWQSELMVSQGCLDNLRGEYLAAVLAHESAHCYHRDTFWFFWLGWLSDTMGWLSTTPKLWQEVLLLREQRADRRASDQVDVLVMAEALLQVASSQHRQTHFCVPALSAAENLSERIEALLHSENPEPKEPIYSWVCWMITALPLATLPFHALVRHCP
jgi:beta-lactamase regulating signal transducer with metallopeptidase domain